MKRFFLVVAAVIGLYLVVRVARHSTTPTSPAPRAVAAAAAPALPRETPTASLPDNAAIMRAFQNHARDVRVDGSGSVSRVLADDNQGERRSPSQAAQRLPQIEGHPDCSQPEIRQPRSRRRRHQAPGMSSGQSPGLGGARAVGTVNRRLASSVTPMVGLSHHGGDTPSTTWRRVRRDPFPASY